MLARLLDRFARWALSRNPVGNYAGEDGRRWAYTIGIGDSPYLTRILFPRVLGCRLFLHHFHRPDAEQHLHNHPWSWARALVLAGGYDEERLLDVVSNAPHEMPLVITKERTVRRWNSLTGDDYHRVLRLHDDTWTLFLTGPRRDDWGFLVDGEHVPWKKYLGVS